MKNKTLQQLLVLASSIAIFALLLWKKDYFAGNLHSANETAALDREVKTVEAISSPKASKTTKKPKNEKEHKEDTMNNNTANTELIQHYQSQPAYSIVDVKGFSKKEIKELFTISKISDDIFSRMYKKSYKKDCTVPRETLRYIRVLHMDGDGNTRIGELVVNKSISTKLKDIFYKLYKADYAIEKMVLVDAYNADDNVSMADNNSSAFNYRVVEGTSHLSKHSQGLAIDINPRYNPYIHKLNGSWVCSPENGSDYQDRSKDFPYKIDTNDLAYKLFTGAGFSWGGAWNSSKDYQHFQYD